MRYRSFDIYILIFFVAAGAFGGHRLFADSDQKKISGERVAVLASANNTVKEKQHGLWAWEDSVQGDVLSVGDQIYTYENSSAKLRFDKGQLLDIGQNTLFKIVPSESSTGVAVERGIVTADLRGSNSNLEILIDGKRYQLESSNARVQIISGEKSKRINLIQGEVKIQNEDQKNVLLQKNQYWHYAGGEAEVERYHAEIKGPLEGETLFYSNQRPEVRFKWVLNKPGLCRIIIALDEGFKQIVAREELEESFYIAQGFGDGQYFWKIEDSSGQAISRLATFTLREDRPLDLYAPEDGMISYVSDLGTSEVLLEWEERGFRDFDIEIEDSEKKRQLERISGKAVYQFVAKKLGFYRFRVRPLIADKPFRWSSWTHFGFKEMVRPSPPVVVFPQDDFEISFFDKDKAEVELRWLERQGVERYQLDISSVGGVVVEGSSYRLNVQDAGDFRWRIRSLDPRGEMTSYSKEYRFRVNYVEYNSLAPQNGALIELKKPNQKVSFEWKKVGRSRYLFQLSDEASFARIKIEKEVSRNQVNMRFPEIGTYFWRIKILDGRGNINYSKPIKVKVSPTPPPEKPDQLIQDSEVEIEIEVSELRFHLLNLFISSAYANQISTIAKINWKKDENASKYLIEIYTDAEMDQLFLKKTVSSNSLKIDAAKAGIYYWRIAVIDHWNRQSPFSDLYKLMFKIPARFRNFKAAKITDYHLKNNNLLFKWGRKERDVKYMVEVARDKAFKKRYLTKALTKKSAAIVLKEDGKYFLRVVARGEFIGKINGEDVSVIFKKRVKVAKKIIVKRNKKNAISLYYAPELISYDQVESQHDVDINGVVFNGLLVNGKYQLGKVYTLDISIKRIAGKVFNDNTLIDTDCKALVQRDLWIRKKIYVGAGLGAYFNFSRYYQYVNEDMVTDEVGIYPGVIISGYGIYKWKDKQDLHFDVGFGFLSQTIISMRGYYSYFYNKKMKLLLGLGYGYRNIGSKGVSSYAIGVNAGVQFLL